MLLSLVRLLFGEATNSLRGSNGRPLSGSVTSGEPYFDARLMSVATVTVACRKQLLVRARSPRRARLLEFAEEVPGSKHGIEKILEYRLVGDEFEKLARDSSQDRPQNQTESKPGTEAARLEPKAVG